MNEATLATYSSRKLINLEQKITKQITQVQREYDAARIKSEKKIKSLKADLIKIQQVQIEKRQKQIEQMEEELQPTEKCLEALESQTALITPANEDYSSQKVLQQAKEQGII